MHAHINHDTSTWQGKELSPVEASIGPFLVEFLERALNSNDVPVVLGLVEGASAVPMWHITSHHWLIHHSCAA